jgi:hypothetical protein
MMNTSRTRSTTRTARWLLCLLALACAPMMMGSVAAAGATTGSTPGAPGEGTQTKLNPSATLQECLTEGAQAERAATFEGEMAVIPGAARMEMRINIQERLPRELVFHVVSAPGLGVWRRSAAGVKTYTYLKQVTNLSAPAIYRGAVEFRWMTARGRILKTALLLTSRCRQPAIPKSETSPEGTEASGTTPTEAAGKTGAPTAG